MAVLSLTSATIYGHGYDFSGDTNKVSLKAMADELDTTTFASGGYRERIGGLRAVEFGADGFWQAGSGKVAEELFPDLGTADRVFTVCPTGTAATTAYMFQAGKFSVEEFAAVGDVAPFSLSAMGTSSHGLIRGQLAKAKGSVSATGVLGSVLNITAPTASQYIYVAVHCFSAGTTVTIQLQSDTASNFPSATTQATLSAITSAGGTWMTRVAGGSLSGEDYWRLNVSAITGTFSLAAAIGVGS